VADQPCTVPVVVVVTGTVQEQAWEDKVLPPVAQYRPGPWSIPVSIPDTPLRHVLVDALEPDGGGVATVRAGWDTDEAWGALAPGLATAGGSISDVAAVPGTRIHPDHYGLAGRVRETSGAWIGLHPHDAVMLDQEEIGLPAWRLWTTWTPGHSTGHVCIHCAEHRPLLSGDHLLPRITLRLHRSRPWDELEPYVQRQAIGETLAHCVLLELHEWIRREGAAPAHFFLIDE